MLNNKFGDMGKGTKNENYQYSTLTSTPIFDVSQAVCVRYSVLLASTKGVCMTLLARGAGLILRNGFTYAYHTRKNRYIYRTTYLFIYVNVSYTYFDK